MSLRCSSLPKLAACPCFKSKPGDAGPAARRGTALDVLWRFELAGMDLAGGSDHERAAVDAVEITKADRAAVKWAVERARLIAKGRHLQTIESKVRVTPPYVGTTGTMDGLICEEIGELIDLKTGMVRDYEGQMAAYALACMEETFSTEWTAHLLFCDAREKVTHKFTYEQADRIVRDIVAAYHDPHKSPTPCEYCSWCAHAMTCDARLTLAENALTVRHLSPDGLEELTKHPVRLSQFLRGAKVVAEIEEQAKESAKELGSLPGFKVIDMSGREFVPRERLLNFIAERSRGGDDPFGPFDILEICPTPSPTDLRDLLDERFEEGAEELETDWLLVARGEGHKQLRAVKTKQAK